MAKLPSTGLIVVPQPPISMADVSAENTGVGTRHYYCPLSLQLAFCDVKANTRPFVGGKWPP